MTSEQETKMLLTLDALERQMARIADALERVSPPPVDRRHVVPAGPENLSRPSLADLKRHEDDEREQRDRLTLP